MIYRTYIRSKDYKHSRCIGSSPIDTCKDFIYWDYNIASSYDIYPENPKEVDHTYFRAVDFILTRH